MPEDCFVLWVVRVRGRAIRRCIRRKPWRKLFKHEVGIDNVFGNGFWHSQHILNGLWKRKNSTQHSRQPRNWFYNARKLRTMTCTACSKLILSMDRAVLLQIPSNYHNIHDKAYSQEIYTKSRINLTPHAPFRLHVPSIIVIHEHRSRS